MARSGSGAARSRRKPTRHDERRRRQQLASNNSSTQAGFSSTYNSIHDERGYALVTFAQPPRWFLSHANRTSIVLALYQHSSITPLSMADRPVSPLKEESATTREEMDFDEPEQETGTVSPLGHETPTKKPDAPRKSVSFQEPEREAPPSMPPRPMSPQQQAENTLIEAFPSIDTKVVKAVLSASGGKVEPAFNALLGMSDPDFQAEEPAAPRQPPRPTQTAPRNQLEADELYARQLADQYNAGTQRSQTRYNQRDPAMRGPNRQRQDSDDSERNFFDDDLPEIGRNIQQGFMETQKRVNSWITNFKKKIDGEDEDEDEDLYSSGPSRQQSYQQPGRQNFGSSQTEQMHGIRKQAEAQQYAQRRSTEANRYDADPHEFDADQFERLELRDDEAPPAMPPRTSSRKSANPDLFKPQPKPPQSGPVDEVDAAERRTSGTDGEKSRKWQSLTSVAPHPEEDNDPFSLGDDDDDKEKTEDLRKEDTERLKEKARSSVSAGAGEGGLEKLEPQESQTSGTKNKEMEELLSGAGKKQ